MGATVWASILVKEGPHGSHGSKQGISLPLTGCASQFAMPNRYSNRRWT